MESEDGRPWQAGLAEVDGVLKQDRIENAPPGAATRLIEATETHADLK